MSTRNKSKQWMACAGATIMLFCVGGLIVSAFSVYLPYICSANGFSNAQSSSLLTIRSLAGMLLMLVVDRFYKKVGLHWGATIALVVAALGMLLYSLSQNYLSYCVAAALCGAAFCLGTIAAPLLIEGWFAENRGVALGIATAGTGIASIISPIIIVPLIENRSLQFAFRMEAIFVAVCAVAVFMLVRNPAGKKKTDEVETGAEVAKKSTFALPKSTTGILYIAVFLGGLIVFGITTAMPPLFKEVFDGSQMSVLTSLFGVALLVGKIVYGRLVDKTGTYFSNYILFVMLIIGTVGVCVARNLVLAAVATICLGLGTPLNNLGVPTYAKDLCTAGSYAKAVKYLTLAGNVASLVISFTAGVVADAYGSYVPVFVILVVMVALCAVLTQLVYIKWNKIKEQ